MPNIDERIVQMRFDNKQFEQGVSESLKTLEKLKNELKLEESSKSLLNLNNVISKVNFSSIEDGIDRVANAFTPLGKIAQKTLDTIADKAVDTGKKLINMLTGFNDMVAGKAKYELETKSVMTITNATGKSVEEVEGVLHKLMRYTDETSYDFAQMASSIGKFTSVGVELEAAEEAMEGIANWAAKSGADKQAANRAMYNISQAMGTGSMMIRDWMSIENANMATKEFKETAIETAKALGYLADAGEGVGKILSADSKGNIREVTVDYQTFRETLSRGWLSADVLTETLRRYGDQTTEFGMEAYRAAQNALTFTDAIDAVRDAVSSGWMQTLKHVFGDLDEARVFWTDLATWMQNLAGVFSEARNNLLESWHNLGGYQAFIDSITNAWFAFENIVLGVREAIQQVFPPMWAENLVDITEKVRDATGALMDMFSIDRYEDAEEEIVEIVDRAKELNKVLKDKDAGEAVAQLQEALFDTGYYKNNDISGIYDKDTQEAIKKLQRDLKVKVTGEWDKATREAAIANKTFQKSYTTILTNKVQTEFLSKAMSRVQEMVQGVAGALKIVFTLLKGGFKIVKDVLSIFNPVIDLIARIGAMFGMMIKNLSDDLENGGMVAEFVESITTLLEPLANTIERITEFFHDFIDTYAYALKETNRKNTFGNFFAFLMNYLKNNTILGPIVSLGETIVAIVVNVIGNVIGIITDTVKTIGYAIGELFGIVNKEDGSESGLITFLKIVHGFAFAAAQTLSYLIQVARPVIQQLVSSVMAFVGPVIKNVLSIAVSLVYLLLDNLPTILPYLVQLAPVILSIVGAFIALKKVRGPANGFGTSLMSIAGVLGFFLVAANKDKIWGFLTGLYNKFKDLNVVKGVSGLFGKIIDKFKEWLELDTKMSLFDRIKTGLSNLTQFIFQKLKAIGESFVTLFAPTDPKEQNMTFFERLKERLTPFANWLHKIAEAIGKDLSDIFGGTLDFASIPGSVLGKLFEGLKNIFKSVASAAGDVLNSGYMDTIISGIFAVGFYKLGKGIADFSKNLEKSLKVLTGHVDKKDTLGTTALKFAGAVAIISASMLLLSQIHFEENKGVINGLDAFIRVVGVMVVAAAALKAADKFLSSGKNSLKSATSIIQFSASVALIGAGLLMIQKFLSGTNVDKTLWLLGGIIIILAALEIVMLNVAKTKNGGNVNTSVGGILSMCKGVVAIALAISLLSWAIGKDGTNFDRVRSATIMIGILIAELGGIAIAMTSISVKKNKGTNDSSVKGIVSLCLGVLAVVAAIGLLAFEIKHNDWWTMTKAFGAIVIIVGGLGILAYNIAKVASGNKLGSAVASIGGILSMSLSAIVVVEAIAKLARLIKNENLNNEKGDAVTTAFFMIATMLTAIGAFTYAIMKSGKDLGGKQLIGTLVLLAVVFAGVILTINALGDSLAKASAMDTESLSSYMNGLVGLIAVVGMMAVALVALKADMGTMLQVAVGLGAILIGIGVGLSALISLGADAIEAVGQALQVFGWSLESYSRSMSSINWEDVNTSVDFIKNTLPGMLTALIGQIFNLNRANEATTLLVSLGADLSLYAGNLSSIGNIESINGNGIKLIEGAKQICDIAVTITIPDFIKNAELTSLGSELSMYATGLSKIDTAGLQNGINTANNAKEVASIIKQIGIDDKVSTTLTNFGQALRLYYAAIAGAGYDEDGNPIKITDGATIDSDVLEAVMSGLANAIKVDDIQKIRTFAEGQENDMTLTALGISAIGQALSTYATDIKGIDAGDVKTANNVLNTVADIYTKLEASNLDKDVEYIEKLESDDKLSTFARGIESLGTALSKYKEDIGGIDKGEVEGANSVLESVTELDKYLNSKNADTFIDIDGIRSSIPTETNLQTFANQLTTLGTGVSKYVHSVDGVTDEQIASANRVLSFVAGIQDKLPNTGFSLSKLLLGEKNIKNFSQGLTAIGGGLRDYKQSLEETTFTDNDEKAFGFIKSLAESLTILGRSNGVKGLIEGNFSWAPLAANLGLVGTALVEFKTALNGVVFTDEEAKAFTYIEKLANALGTLGRSGGLEEFLSGKFEWSSLTKGLNGEAGLAGELKRFAGDMKDFQSSTGLTEAFDALDRLEEFIILAQQLFEMQGGDWHSGGSIFDSITNGIQTMLTNLATFSDDPSGIYVLESVRAFGVQLVKNMAGGFLDADETSGQNPLESALNELIQNGIEKSKELLDQFKDVGRYLCAGMAYGIKEKLDIIIQAVRDMNVEALEQVYSDFEINSPSKKFAWVGQMCAIGLVNGMTKYQSTVTDAANSIASGSIETIMAAFKNDKLNFVGKGALYAIKELLLEPFKDNKDAKYTDKEMNVVKQLLVQSKYLSEENIDNVDAVKSAINSFKEEVLGVNDALNGSWNYTDSLKLWHTINEEYYKNGNKGYSQLEYQIEMMEMLGIEAETMTDELTDANNRFADSIENITDMYATLSDEQKKLVRESVDPVSMTEILFQKNEADELTKNMKEHPEWFNRDISSEINYDSPLNSMFELDWDSLLGGMSATGELPSGITDMLDTLKNSAIGIFTSEDGVFSGIGTNLFSEGGLLSQLKENVIGLFTDKNGVIATIGQKLFGEDGIISSFLNSDNPIEVPIQPVVDMSQLTNAEDGINGNVGLSLQATNLTADFSTAAAQIITSASSSEIDKLNELKTAMIESGTVSKQAIQNVETRIASLSGDIRNLKLYLDGDTLIGWATPRLDRTLGFQSKKANRLQ